MCGLVGYKTKLKTTFKRSTLLNSIAHRGPDSKNFFQDIKNNFFFGFTRLSIIDLKKRSDQPYIYKNLVICFNGEIYNFKKLKKFLIKSKKINFNTNSDTEVLIKLIFYEGLEKALEMIEGMWAFALYDTKAKNLILCRDRFGEKPLLYYKNKDNIFFGSELPAFKIFLKKKFKINKSYLKKYLFYDYRYLNQDFENFIEKIKKVPQSSYLKISKNLDVSTHKYFNFLNKKENSLSYKKVIYETKKKLINLTNNSMISDRPIAFCLSGGIDSTGLVSIAKKYLKKKIKCFTIYTDDKKYDEFDMVNKTVKDLNVDHEWIKINRNKTFENLKKIIKHRKYPVLTVTSYIQWLMFKEIAKNKIKVVISGNGSDEIFSGYYDHHLAYLNDINKYKKLKKKSILKWEEKIKPLIRNPLMKDYVNYSKNKNYIKIIKGANYQKDLSKKTFSLKFKDRKFTKTFLKNRMINEMFYESVPVLLQEEDINAMFFSIENRSPYLNSNLYKFLINLPVKYFIDNGYAKSILRKSLKGISPNHILNNYEKIGFNISASKLLDFKSKKINDFIKKKSPIYKFIKRGKVFKILKNDDMIEKYSNFLFKFINAKIFLEAHK